MSKPPKIDITQNIMSQIDSGEVKMRPKSYFVARTTAKYAGLIAIGLILLATVFYVVIVIQNGVFKEYLEFGKQGSGIYWSSLPWGAIIISVLLTIAVSLGIYLIQQKRRFVPTLVGSFVAVALVAAVIFRIGPDPNTSALARAVVGVDGNPTKIAGTVEEKNGDTIKVKSSDGKIITIKINSSTLGNKEFELGDEVLVLGNEQNGSVNANAIKTTKKAEKKVVEVKQAEPTKTEPEEKPAEETKPEQKPTATAPVFTAPTTPTPTPPAVSNTIVITGTSGPYTTVPRKFKVTFTTNFASPFGYKMVWSMTPGPVYPGSNNTYLSSATTPGTYLGAVTEDFGPGTYYVRVCEKTASGCGLYSNQITVVFP